jgi:hypothetical protein
MSDAERVAELEKLVESEQSRANELANKLNSLRLAVQKNCGHWYEPGYGLRCWIHDKWVPADLRVKPEGEVPLC